MNTLTQLRAHLQRAEQEYRTANGSLDSSPLELIVCREALSQARFAYSKACEQFVEETLFCEDGA